MITQRIFSEYLQNSLSEQLSLLWYLDLLIVALVTSPDSQLHLLLWGRFWLHLSFSSLQLSLKTINWSKYKNVNIGLYKMPLEYILGHLTFSGGINKDLVGELIIIINNTKNHFPDYVEKNYWWNFEQYLIFRKLWNNVPKITTINIFMIIFSGTTFLYFTLLDFMSQWKKQWTFWNTWRS